MLGVRDTRRVAWRRQHARRHYVGYVCVTEETVRLASEHLEPFGSVTHDGHQIRVSVSEGATAMIEIVRSLSEPTRLPARASRSSR